jgi:hypothetical protein
VETFSKAFGLTVSNGHIVGFLGILFFFAKFLLSSAFGVHLLGSLLRYFLKRCERRNQYIHTYHSIGNRRIGKREYQETQSSYGSFFAKT